MTRRTRLAGALVALACLGSLNACGGDDVVTSTDPVEVEVGKAFSWGDYSIDDGWTLEAIKRSAGGEEVTTPEVKGTITNHADEERSAVYPTGYDAVVAQEFRRDDTSAG